MTVTCGALSTGCSSETIGPAGAAWPAYMTGYDGGNDMTGDPFATIETLPEPARTRAKGMHQRHGAGLGWTLTRIATRRDDTGLGVTLIYSQDGQEVSFFDLWVPAADLAAGK